MNIISKFVQSIKIIDHYLTIFHFLNWHTYLLISFLDNFLNLPLDLIFTTT